MEHADYGTFELAFRRLSSALRLKVARKEEADDLPRTYFKILQAYPLAAVLDAGRACASTMKAFPKPVEWLAELPKPQVITHRQMTVAEQDERTRAERLRFRDDPCDCDQCVEAGVTDRQLRYVPTVFGDGEADSAYNPRRKDLAIAGHWAHGEELRRWYLAREAFVSSVGRLPRGTLRTTGVVLLRQGDTAIITREPGEEG